MSLRSICHLCCILLLGLGAYTQPLPPKAQAAYQAGDYATVLPLLQKALDRTSDFNLCEPLAMCHLRTGDPLTAIALWELAEAAGKQSDTALLYQTIAELQMGRYDRARARLAEVPFELQTHDLFDSLTSCLARADRLTEDSLHYRLIPVRIQNWDMAMCPQWYSDGLLVAGCKRAGKGRRPALQVGLASRINLFSFEAPQDFTPLQREGYRDGPAVVSPSEQRIFFTRTFDKYPDPVNRMTKGGLSRILMVEKKAGTWSPTTELNLNSWQFSNAHPSLAPNDSAMIFVSNRPGGQGGADLYQVRLAPGGWEIPVNLGPIINTAGNEFFPTWVGEDTLYFASDGHRGLGGLDIYLTWEKNGEWQPPINLGYPVNSPKDDFGIHLLRHKGIAYISSNRGEDEQEHIYAAMYAVRADVKVMDALTSAPLPGAHIRRIDRAGMVTTYTANAEGMALVDLEMSGGAYLEIEAEDHLGTHLQISSLASLPGNPPLNEVRLERAFVAKIKGKATLRQDGSPVAGVQVRATYARDSLHLHAISRPDGEYEMELPAFGKVFLLFEKVGIRTEVAELNFPSNTQQKVHLLDVMLREGQTQLIEVGVRDLQGLPLADATVEVLSGERAIQVAQAQTNGFGRALLSVEWDEEQAYTVAASAEGYGPREMALPKLYTPAVKEVGLDLRPIDVDQLAKIVYYTTNQTTTPEFTDAELKLLSDFVRAAPESQIEIRSFTDALGRARYNQRLSERRANSLRRYFGREAGISLARITAKGFGERFLLNECDDHHPCDPSRHAQNRRSEVWLLSRKPELKDDE